MRMPPRQFVIKKTTPTSWIKAIDLSSYRDDLPPGVYAITITPYEYIRSYSANAYYHAVVVCAVANETGYTPLETHSVLKSLFFPVAAPTEQCETIPGSTKGLYGSDFWEYIERIRAWAAEWLHLYIPDPHCWDLSDEKTQEKYRRLGRVPDAQVKRSKG